MALPTIKKNKEVWKDIKGYKGIYQVSKMGSVRSLDRMVPHDRTCLLYTSPSPRD